MAEWQPIETVPRDGTVIDLWHRVCGRTPQVWWEERDGWVRRGWEPLTIQDGYTYWMPVPDSPLAPPPKSKYPLNPTAVAEGE